MLRLIRLLLPVLFPSWRFFKDIAPSPRIELRGDGGRWTRLEDRPAVVSASQSFGRLFWNPAWNADLFLVSLADRLASEPREDIEKQLHTRLSPHLTDRQSAEFRLVFVSREGDALVEEVVYQSAPWRLGPSADHKTDHQLSHRTGTA